MQIQIDIKGSVHKWLQIQKILRNKITLANTAEEILEEQSRKEV